MEKFYIRGGIPLTGTVKIGGAKNAAVAIMPAALLADEPCTIDNLPHIDDVITLAEILQEVGAKVKLNKNGRITIDGSTVKSEKAPYDMAKRMRASYYLLGVFLGKFGKAEILCPAAVKSVPVPLTSI